MYKKIHSDVKQLQQNQETLLRMIHPKSIAELGGEPVSDNDLEAELQSLTLEEFLEML